MKIEEDGVVKIGDFTVMINNRAVVQIRLDKSLIYFHFCKIVHA